MDSFLFFDAVILGAGDFPSHPLPLSVLRSAPYVCCCDSAAVEYVARVGVPDAIVGDGDSLPDSFKQRYADIWHHVGEQDDNDQTKATRHCVGHGFRRMAYLGATGKREDHTLGNISLMAQYVVDFGIEPVMLTDHGVFMASTCHIELPTTAGQQVSVFNIGSRHIQSSGLRWPCRAFTNWWQGTLNEAMADRVAIDSDGSVIVYLCYLE